MKRHKNIPVFIPHLGCPNNCVFCNQRKISGTMCFNRENVNNEIKEALKTVNPKTDEVQIAFFGGSFTGIDREDMIYLLEIANRYIKNGEVDSVRLSTRPDYIDEEILDILKAYGVKTIELGLQSMSDKVLLASGRGHSAKCSREACKLIKNYGFELIGQMMTALPKSTPEDEIFTANELLKMKVDGARIYPTMVFAGTELENMAKSGSYQVPTLENLISRTADAFSVFAENNIPVIRIGLQSSDGLGDENGIVLSPYESAMGEMVISEYYFKKIAKLLDEYPKGFLIGKNLQIFCHPGEISKIVGQHKLNKMKINTIYGMNNIKLLEKSTIMLYNVLINVC